MLEQEVEIEMKVTTKNGKVNGCVLYHEETLANMQAMCYIRQAVVFGQFRFCNGILLISTGDKHYPFSGDSNQLMELCSILNDRNIVFRQLYVFSKGRYVTVIGNGLAEEERARTLSSYSKMDSSINNLNVVHLFGGSKKQKKQRSLMKEKCYFAQ